MTLYLSCTALLLAVGAFAYFVGRSDGKELWEGQFIAERNRRIVTESHLETVSQELAYVSSMLIDCEAKSIVTEQQCARLQKANKDMADKLLLAGGRVTFKPARVSV